MTKFVQGRTLGFLGEPRVDVLTLNIALAELPGQSAGYRCRLSSRGVREMTAAASGQPGEPRPAGHPAVAPHRDKAAHPAAAARILIVEDQPELLRALRINLRARQYEVATAATGREALASAVANPPDAVILDLGLPDIDGIEVIVELRRW